MKKLWIGIALALTLAACGGGGDSAVMGVGPAGVPQAAEVNAEQCTSGQGALDDVQPTQVGDRCLLRYTALDQPAAKSALAPMSSIGDATPSPTELFNWAQLAYPTLFPGAPANQSIGGFVVRYYAGSATYLGVAGEDVYVMGSVSGGKLMFLGRLVDFTCRVFPSACVAPTATPTAQALTLGKVCVNRAVMC